MEQEMFFVGIREPIELRKELLTSSKQLIDSLKRYEHYHLVKETKQEHIIALKKVFDELLLLNKKFRAKLPKVPMKVPTVFPDEKISVPAQTKKSSDRQEKQAKLRPEPLSKLDLLEQELAKVEERLGKLE